MRYEIVWSSSAQKALRKLERPVAKRILKAVEGLEKDPYKKVRKIVNSPWYRLRVGDYRVFIGIYDDKLVVLVLDVDHRKRAYRKP